MNVPRLQPGWLVTLVGFVERYDEDGDMYLVAIRPRGLRADDPGPVQRLWVSRDEISGWSRPLRLAKDVSVQGTGEGGASA